MEPGVAPPFFCPSRGFLRLSETWCQTLKTVLWSKLAVLGSSYQFSPKERCTHFIHNSYELHSTTCTGTFHHNEMAFFRCCALLSFCQWGAESSKNCGLSVRHFDAPRSIRQAASRNRITTRRQAQKPCTNPHGASCRISPSKSQKR